MFETVMQAYNAYKHTNTKTIEARAEAINAEIRANANADVAGYAIELEALERVIEERGQQEPSATVPEVAHTASETRDEGAASTPEYRSAFFKHLQGRDLTEGERIAFDRANVERRDFNNLTNAAAVVPTTTLNEVISKATDMGGIMGIARGFNMPSNISIPVATPMGAAQWHVEGAEVTPDKASTVPVTFAANEIMKVISISAAVQTMSIGAFESYLVDELTNSVMAALASAMVSGTGSGQATGILSGITWKDADTASASDRINQVTVAANATLTYADVLAAIALLHRGYSTGAKFVMNNTTLYQDVYGIHDDVNRPVYLADLVNGGPGRILGFDVIVDDYMPDDTILFGNFKFCGYNLPAGIAIDMSRESSFKSGLVDYRAIAIADAKPIVPEAFVKIAKA